MLKVRIVLLQVEEEEGFTVVDEAVNNLVAQWETVEREAKVFYKAELGEELGIIMDMGDLEEEGEHTEMEEEQQVVVDIREELLETTG